MSRELQVGDAAPDFELPDAEGKTHRLSDYRGKTVVLYFYPKDNTPGCTQEACDFRDGAAAYRKRGALILGVSPDSAASHAKFRDKFELSFPLLADPDRRACEAYGVWKEKSLYGRKFMGVERSTFVIDPKGKIQRIIRKVKVAGHAADVLQQL